jgi:hypothetical protein
MGDNDVDDHYSDHEQEWKSDQEYGEPDFSHDVDGKQQEARALEQKLFDLSISRRPRGSKQRGSPNSRQRTPHDHDYNEKLENDDVSDNVEWVFVDEDDVRLRRDVPLRPRDMFDVPLRPIDMINFGFKRWMDL